MKHTRKPTKTNYKQRIFEHLSQRVDSIPLRCIEVNLNRAITLESVPDLLKKRNSSPKKNRPKMRSQTFQKLTAGHYKHFVVQPAVRSRLQLQSHIVPG